MTEPKATRRPFQGWDIATLAVVLALGLLSLPLPIGGDQALFIVGARQISGGAVLYKDFWELNQPGIYLFNLIAGLSFGFNEIGTRLFELLWMVAFSVLAIQTSKSEFASAWAARAVPVLSIGVFYAVSTPRLLTQKESLVGPVLYLLLWILVKRAKSRWWVFAAGVLSSVILATKILYLPLVLMFWLIAFWDRSVLSVKGLRRFSADVAVPALLGLLLPISVLVGYFAYQGALREFVQTTLVIPPKVVSLHQNPSTVLIESTQWFLSVWAPLLGLAAFGVLARARELNRFTLGLTGWGLLGLLIIPIQRTSGWDYHFLVSMIPIGFLAALGLDSLEVSRQAGLRRAAIAAGLVLALSTSAATLTYKVMLMAKHGLAFSGKSLLEWQGEVYPKYARMVAEVEFLSEPGLVLDRAYVLGDPRYLYLSGRDQPVPLNGWSPEWFLPEQWDELARQIESVRPEHFFVENYNIPLLKKNGKQLEQVLEDHYSIRKQVEGGIWYEINSGPGTH